MECYYNMAKIQHKACSIKRIKNIILTLESIDKHAGQESDTLPPSIGSATSLDRSINFSGFQVPANERFEKDDV